MKTDTVLIAKIEAPSYSSAGIVRAMRNEFENVYEFNYQNVMFQEGADGMRKRLMGMCMMYQPDIIFLHIQNPEPLDMDVIQFLSERAFVVLYTFDVRENIDWYKEYAPYVGLILFADAESIDACKKDGIENVDYLQSSVDMNLYRPLPPGVEPDKEYGDIIFIGNNFLNTNLNFPLAQQRVDMVNFMKEQFGDRFHVYGIGWPGSRMLNPMEEIAAYHSCKIAITHNNFLRTGYTSDRLWRAIACGALTVSQQFEPYGQYDIPRRAMPMWSTFKDIRDYCNFFLDPYWAQHKSDVREEQYQHLKSNASWANRILKFKQLIKNHGYSKRVEDVSGIGTGSPQ